MYDLGTQLCIISQLCENHWKPVYATKFNIQCSSPAKRSPGGFKIEDDKVLDAFSYGIVLKLSVAP